MQLLSSKQYVSFVINTQVHCLLAKKKSQFYITAVDTIEHDCAGIFEGHLINPSFFIDALCRFFKKNNLKRPLVAFITSPENTAYSFRYGLYFEHFGITLKHLATKVGIHSIEKCAVDIWQGEIHGV